MSSDWATTCAPGSRIVGNAKLKPFTLGHALLLERLGIEVVLTRLDFHAFVGICSRNHAQGLEWIEWFLSPVGQWFYAIKPIGGKFEDIIQDAIDYMRENKSLPQLLEVENSGINTYGTPSLQAARTIAISQLGYNPQTINDAPIGQLYWDILSNNELNGGSKIIAGEIQAGINELERRQKERENNES